MAAAATAAPVSRSERIRSKCGGAFARLMTPFKSLAKRSPQQPIEPTAPVSPPEQFADQPSGDFAAPNPPPETAAPKPRQKRRRDPRSEDSGVFGVSAFSKLLTLFRPKIKSRPQQQAATEPPESLSRQLRYELGFAYAYAGLLTLFINLAMLFVPLYSMIIFNRVLQSKSYDTLTMLTIVCVIGMAIYACLEFYRSMIFVVIADKLTRGLNISTLRASLARSLSGEPSAGAQAIRDLDALRMFASSSSPIVSLDLIWTPIVLVILYLLHPWYGHYALICAAVLFVLSVANDLSTRESLIAASTASASSLSDLSSALRQRELIDGLGMLPEIARHWMAKQNSLQAQAGVVSRRSSRFAVAAKTARIAMQAGGLAVGVILVIHSQASPGSLIGASILLGKLLQPFEQLLTAWRQWTAALASWRRITDLLATATPRSRQAAPDKVEGRLVLDHVSFAPLSANSPILEDVSLTIEPGEVIAVVGSSGAGKSTLARLIMGILSPTSGQVTFDGVATSEWDRAELARHVSYLAQSVGLLDGTILDNIARMDLVDPIAAIDATNRAGVHDLVGRLRDGYDTQVGDSGQALSGGTRQRIALARALYGQPKLIVLDEPNAHLDHDGEQALVHVIKQIKASGAAVLLITHRPSILACVDRVVTLEHGGIARIDQPLARPELAKPRRAAAQAAV